MRQIVCLILPLVLLIYSFVAGCGKDKVTGSPVTGEAEPQFRWLVKKMDEFVKTFDVYTDIGAAGNHFVVLGKMWGNGPMMQ